MLEITLSDQSRLVAWAEKRIGVTFFSDARAIGWGTPFRLRAVTVYDRWSESDCHIHLAGEGQFASRKFLAASYWYPFVTHNRRRITGLVPASNHRALKLNHHMGFQHEGVMRDGAPDGDLIILGMLRKECRFLPREHRSM